MFKQLKKKRINFIWNSSRAEEIK